MTNPNANQGHTERINAISMERAKMWQTFLKNYQYHMDQGSEQFQQFAAEFRDKFLNVGV